MANGTRVEHKRLINGKVVDVKEAQLSISPEDMTQSGQIEGLSIDAVVSKDSQNNGKPFTFNSFMSSILSKGHKFFSYKEYNELTDSLVATGAEDKLRDLKDVLEESTGTKSKPIPQSDSKKGRLNSLKNTIMALVLSFTVIACGPPKNFTGPGEPQPTQTTQVQSPAYSAPADLITPEPVPTPIPGQTTIDPTPSAQVPDAPVDNPVVQPTIDPTPAPTVQPTVQPPVKIVSESETHATVVVSKEVKNDKVKEEVAKKLKVEKESIKVNCDNKSESKAKVCVVENKD